MRRFLRRAPAAALLALILAVNPGCDRQRQARMTGRGRDMMVSPGGSEGRWRWAS